MEAEFRVMWPQAKEYVQPPEAGRGEKTDCDLECLESV